MKTLLILTDEDYQNDPIKVIEDLNESDRVWALLVIEDLDIAQINNLCKTYLKEYYNLPEYLKDRTCRYTYIIAKLKETTNCSLVKAFEFAC